MNKGKKHEEAAPLCDKVVFSKVKQGYGGRVRLILSGAAPLASHVNKNNNPFSLLREPLMLISGIFFLFVTCIIYVHADLTISKSSPSYIAKLQWDEVQAVVQQVGNIIRQSLIIHNKLEGSLRELSRIGEIQTCKSTRKAVENSAKELSKELKPLLTFLQSSPQAS